MKFFLFLYFIFNFLEFSFSFEINKKPVQNKKASPFSIAEKIQNKMNEIYSRGNTFETEISFFSGKKEKKTLLFSHSKLILFQNNNLKNKKEIALKDILKIHIKEWKGIKKKDPLTVFIPYTWLIKLKSSEKSFQGQIPQLHLLQFKEKKGLQFGYTLYYDFWNQKSKKWKLFPLLNLLRKKAHPKTISEISFLSKKKLKG